MVGFRFFFFRRQCPNTPASRKTCRRQGPVWEQGWPSGVWGGLGYKGQKTSHVNQKTLFSRTCVVCWPWGWAFGRSKSVCPNRNQGVPDVFLLAKLFVGGLGYQGQKTTHLPENNGVFALPPKVARPKNHGFRKHVWFVGLGMPGLQKNAWPTKTRRDPFEFRRKDPTYPGISRSATSV